MILSIVDHHGYTVFLLNSFSVQMSVILAFASVLIVSAMSLVGVLVLTLRQSIISAILLYLVSFSTGAILGTVFFHLLPEVMEHSSDPVIGSALILGGMMLAFCIEKFIHWHHCHHTEHDETAGRHTHPVGPLILIGDGIHNFIDGMLIASAYLVSVPVGLAATVAVLLHEIPQELSDISLLLHSGFSRHRAILWNTISACTALLGAAVAIGFQSRVAGIEYALLPIAAGNFLYIATTDLIPELHKETRFKKSIVQLLLILAGMGLMAMLALRIGHGHDEQEGDHEDVHKPAELLINVMDADGHPTDAGLVQVRVRGR